jgi:hypothetical protein
LLQKMPGCYHVCWWRQNSLQDAQRGCPA